MALKKTYQTMNRQIDIPENLDFGLLAGVFIPMQSPLQVVFWLFARL